MKYTLAEQKLQNLLKAVSEETEIPEDKILARRGKVKVSDARNLLCYLGMSKKIGSGNIGRFLDNRDHSTILFNSKAFAAHSKYDANLRILLCKVENKVA